MASQLSVAARNTMLDALATEIGSTAYLQIYTGSPPTNCATASSGTLLAEFHYSGAFKSSTSAGVLTANLPPSVTASADGIAGYYRLLKTDHSTCVYQDIVTGTNPGLVLNPSNDQIFSGQAVQINSHTVNLNAAA